MRAPAVLFVCRWNQIRSPLAAAMLKARLKQLGYSKQLLIDSAGIRDCAGLKANAALLSLNKHYDLELVHKQPRTVIEEDFAFFQRVYALDEDVWAHCRHLQAGPDDQQLVRLICPLSDTQINTIDKQLLDLYQRLSQLIDSILPEIQALVR